MRYVALGLWLLLAIVVYVTLTLWVDAHWQAWRVVDVTGP